jgi:hypothetical protein
VKTFQLTLCTAALLGGIIALINWGLNPPLWLGVIQAALLMGAALVYGFTAYLPTLAPWLWLRPIRGTIFVMLGIAVIYVQPQLLLAAWLIGRGTRLIWLAACQLEESERPEHYAALSPRTTLVRVDAGRELREWAGDALHPSDSSGGAPARR